MEPMSPPPPGPQVHDELIFEVAEDQLRRAAAVVREEMEGARDWWGLRVSFPVMLYTGPSWGHLTEYDERLE